MCWTEKNACLPGNWWDGPLLKLQVVGCKLIFILVRKSKKFEVALS